MSEPAAGRPELEQKAVTFWAEVRDAVSGRTFLLVVSTLLLQLGFILSYVGAFHSPTPHRMALDVVAPAQLSATAVAQLNAAPSAPVRAHAVASESAARNRIRTGVSSGALVLPASGSTDTLLVASGAGVSTSTALTAILEKAETAQGRTTTVEDIVPLQRGDGRGLTGFYLVIGWIVGGYLAAALLGTASGARPANGRRAVIRLASMVPYAIASGLGGAVIVDPVLGALTGHFVALWWLGALLVLASATVTMAFQVLFGVLGIGVTVLFFVVLGNPSAGGAYRPALLPPFWRALSGALPNGAGTDAARRIVYLGANGIATDLVVISIYAAAGIAITALGVRLHAVRTRAGRPKPAGPRPADAISS